MNSWDAAGAHTYLEASENGGLQSDMRKHVFKDFDFSHSDEVLEVGCGTGTACGEIATRVKSVTGIDLSPGMISVANQKHAAPNVDFVVADAHSFGQGWEEKFDKIICLCVLHWCKDQQRVLQNVFRCLKPGGRFLLWFNLQSQIASKSCKYGETGDTWLRAHPKWGPYLTDDIEAITVNIKGLSVTLVYKPPSIIFDIPHDVTSSRINVVIGDFNSHHVNWGYAETNEDVYPFPYASSPPPVNDPNQHSPPHPMSHRSSSSLEYI
ncbi:uncharacterized protein [Diadema antillarum]|uniref:uncharacterized protein n=1 Tax=Diadema antillarum TaxID=105358 RepID=UPI003A89D24D